MYTSLEKYILRTPLLSVNYYFRLTKGNYVSNKSLKEEFEKQVIKESVYLASPVLYYEIDKWTNGRIKDEKQIKKIKISFLKYLSRLSSRPTPFGLFSGSCLGCINSYDSIIINSSSNKRHTRLDMNVTGSIIQKLEKNIFIKNTLRYYPNTSLYNIANKIRYVESVYQKGNLIHQVIEIESSDYINQILEITINGLQIMDIAKSIVVSDIPYEEVIDFILELINSQVLISELQQSVSGDESLSNILKVIKKTKGIDVIIKQIVLIQNKVNKLDLEIGNCIEKYDEIIELLGEMEIDFDKKYIFQVDLKVICDENYLNFKVRDKLILGLTILNKISNKRKNSSLDDFIKVFVERYENQEVPLSLVLDEEIGIGYPINSSKSDINPLIDDLIFRDQNKTKNQNIEWSSFQSILLDKIINSAQSKKLIIELSDKDLENFNIDWKDLPDTMSNISQIVKLNGENRIVLGTVFGSSAANLMGRFCHGDNQINEFVNEIVDYEEKINKDKILAEIIHLPKDRIGNILMRPSFRNFEIPYLSRSNKSADNQININDLKISVKNNKIFLKSIKNNTEVLPRLTTAHNFSNSTIPVYRFLCALQNNDTFPSLGFSWGKLEKELSFLPRIIYKDIILSTAKWYLKVGEVKDIIESGNNSNNMVLISVNHWRKSNNIPQFVYLVEGDNKLLINFKNLSTIEIFFSLIRKRKRIILEEFLFVEDSITKDINNENFVNEFIFSFCKNQA